MSIKFLITGGTIDKIYNPLSGELTFEQSQIQTALQQGNCTTDIEFETVFLKDSLEMTGADRNLICERCSLAEQSKIIISHGTDTMVRTALKISDKNLNKAIVLSGAMIPFSVNNSDALFNLGSAISAVQTLPNGVFVAMNGQVFEAKNVIKNLSLGQFEPL